MVTEIDPKVALKFFVVALGAVPIAFGMELILLNSKPDKTSQDLSKVQAKNPTSELLNEAVSKLEQDRKFGRGAGAFFISLGVATIGIASAL